MIAFHVKHRPGPESADESTFVMLSGTLNGRTSTPRSKRRLPFHVANLAVAGRIRARPRPRPNPRISRLAISERIRARASAASRSRGHPSSRRGVSRSAGGRGAGAGEANGAFSWPGPAASGSYTLSLHDALPISMIAFHVKHRPGPESADESTFVMLSG